MKDHTRIVTISSYRRLFDMDNHVTVPSLIEQAEELIVLGHARGAGCLARQAIEKGLLELCAARGAQVREPMSGAPYKQATAMKKIGFVLETLAVTNSIEPEFKRELDNAIAVGNRAAHAGPLRIAEVVGLVETAIRLTEFTGTAKLTRAERLAHYHARRLAKWQRRQDRIDAAKAAESPAMIGPADSSPDGCDQPDSEAAATILQAQQSGRTAA